MPLQLRRAALALAAFIAVGAAACDADPASGPAPAADATADVAAPDDARDAGPDDTVAPDPGPAIDSLEPTRGSTAGLDEVQIHGRGFTRVVEVTFGESPATEFFAVNDRLIVALTPARPGGLVDVTVIDDEGASARLDLAFTFRDDVLVTLVEPARGHTLGGEPVTIHGIGFGPDATVLFGGRPAPIVDTIDANTLAVITPVGVRGRAEVFVSSRDGVGRYAPGFLYDDGPRIDLITPAGGPLAGGYPITVTGAGFHEPLAVRVGALPLEDVVVHDEGRLSGVVPPGASPGAVDVVVISESGAATASRAFHYLGPVAPGLALLSVHPSRGLLAGGEQVALAVTGLDAGAVPEVSFGDSPATVLSVDPAALSVVVAAPAATEPGAVPVSLRVGGAVVSRAAAWTYVAAPRVDAVTPASGPTAGGTPIVVTGAGFASGASVRVGALAATDVQVVDPGRIEAVTPPGGLGAADVRVASAGVTGVGADAYTFTGAPAVWAVDPPRGAVAGGTRVRVLGHGFPGATSLDVRFGGAPGTDAVALDANTIEVTTPRGVVGPASVSVSGGGVSASHANAFVYFDPGSAPGTWGEPVDGALNVTVLDGRSGMRLAGATVIVGPTGSTTLRGVTDDAGQLTLSAPGLLGDQIVTASRSGYQTAQLAGFDAENVTLSLQPVPTCEDVADIPCDQVVGPGSVAYFDGRVVGTDKGPSLPWGECRDWPERPAGLCTPCDAADACGEDALCAELPGQGFFCTTACAVDADCAGDFACVDVTNTGAPPRCVPPPPEIRVYCDITESSLDSDDQIAFPGVRVPDTNLVSFTTRLGDYAAFCWRGPYVRGEFRPEQLGVTRHLGAFENAQVVRADIRVDIPLRKRVTVEVDRPPMGGLGAATMTVRTALDLGGDGVLEFPPTGDLESTSFEVRLPELTGVLHDGTWDFFAVVEVPSLNGYSATHERGLRDVAHDRDLVLGDDGWEARGGFATVTRGVVGVDGDVLVVGDGGRIARSFGPNHWATQDAGTTRDLHAVHVHESGAAVAVGEAGAATHWDGFLWQPADTGVVATLESVWMSAEDEAWAVGGSALLRWSGGVWAVAHEVPGTTLRGVWYGSALDDGGAAMGDRVWVVGDAGYVAFVDGGALVPLPAETTSTLRAIWGASDAGPIAVGDGGAVLRFDGAGFVAEDAPTDNALYAVWGDAADRIFAVGSRGTVLRFDGAAWRDESNPDHRGTLLAVGGDGDHVRAMGAHELVLGPMLAIPLTLDPPNGSMLTDRLTWTVPPSLDPHFTLLDFQGAAGPCFICGSYFMIPYTDWRAVLDGDLTEAFFPSPQGGTPSIFFDVKEVGIYRVLVDGRFDFDNTTNDGFFNVGWRSWAVRGATYLR